MAQIIDTSSNRDGSTTWIGIVELPGDMDQTLRSEAIINIRQRLENNGWNVVKDHSLGSDNYVFVYEQKNKNQVIYPEKPMNDWDQAIQPYRSVAHGPDSEVNPSDY